MKHYKNIELEPGHDSIPVLYKDDSGNIISFHKEYKGRDPNNTPVTKKGLQVYHYMHNMLANKEYKIDFERPFTLNNKKYKGVIWSVLDLDLNAIYEASSIKNKRKKLITYPNFIKGKTLNEVIGVDTQYDSICGKDFTQKRICRALEKDINKQLLEECKKRGLKEVFRVFEPNAINIKINSSKGDYLNITITDLGNQIFSYLLKINERVAKEIKKILCEEGKNT